MLTKKGLPHLMKTLFLKLPNKIFLQVNVSQAWGILAAIAIIVMPLVYEGMDIHRAFRNKHRQEPKHDSIEIKFGSIEALNGGPPSPAKVNSKQTSDQDVVYVL